VAPVPLLTWCVYFPEHAPAAGTVIRHLFPQAVHLGDIAQDAFRDHRLGPDVGTHSFGLAWGQAGSNIRIEEDLVNLYSNAQACAGE